MSERIRFVGLDVSKQPIAVAIAETDGSVLEYGDVPNTPNAVRRLVATLSREAIVRTAYEAGPTGYPLHRQLTALGIENLVVAPSLIPRRPGDRVKTDQRDATQLARLLRSGDLTPVWVPDEAHEALRDLVRARDDARTDCLRAKHHLSKFLLRHGVAPPAPVGRAWSAKYQVWLNTVTLGDRAAQITFDDYLACVRAALERMRRLDAALLDCAPATPHAALLRGLQAVRGIGFLTAVTIVAEAGDLQRFHSAAAFMAYVGLVPSEHSSGGSRRRGHLTKTGNRLLRHVLGEAAHHARLQPAVGEALRQRQHGVPAEVIQISWRCQQRLHHKYRHLGGRIGRQRAISAVARELAGFVWAIGQAVPRAEVRAA
ncbi:MAG: IS110 family transposase [Candidatus Dormibacteria bacterium]